MRAATRLCLICCIALLVIPVHRLPAPIQEAQESPKPAPSAVPTAKPKARTPTKPKPEATVKLTSTPNRSFAGAWSGNVVANASNGNTAYYSYVIDISDDEKTVLVKMGETGQTISGPPTQFASSRFREALTWTASSPSGTTTYTMRINSNGTASLVREGSITSEDSGTSTYTQTGTLSREGAFTPTSVAQVNTSSATNGATGDNVPIAKPVPDRPGFVYNPFNPQSKVLLKVGNIKSGTKVKDPTSGRSFIVP